MHKFRFRLEKLLLLRKHIEKEWEIKLAAITGICFSIKNQIKTNNLEIKQSRKEYAGEKGSLYLDTLIAEELYIKRLINEILDLEKKLVIKEKERMKIHKKYMKVSMERKVLDKLREKQEKDYYKQQLDEDFKEMDDINTSRAARR